MKKSTLPHWHVIVNGKKTYLQTLMMLLNLAIKTTVQKLKKVTLTKNK